MFKASGSTELIRSHHNVRDSVASDAVNQSLEQVCKKESCEKLARYAFHEINVTLFGSCGTSSANWLPSGSSKVSIPRFEQTVPKVHVLHQSLLSQHHSAVPHIDTNVFIVPHSTRLCLSASASKPDFLSFKPRQEDEDCRCLSLCCK